jgi:hypothetical protein
MSDMKLWKGNKLNQEWQMEDDKIIEGFKEWFQKNKDFGRPLEYCLIWFITSKEGLDSTYEQEEFDILFKKLNIREFDF